MEQTLFILGIALVLTGIMLIVVASMLKSASAVEHQAAGVVLIGPVPILFGNKRMLLPLVFGATLLMVLAIIFYWRVLR
jgi:uncharacterized protein (TIGR00304 family)